MITILVADDQALVRGGLRMILEAEADLEVVAEAADGFEALAAVREASPDLVLMDIHMPRLDGLDATRRILAAARPAPKIVVLTTFDTDDHVYEAIRAGACGFLLKSTSPRQLVESVHAAMSGDTLLAPEITRRLLDRFVERPPVTSGGIPPQLAELSARELEVLRLIAEGHSNGEIAAALHLSEATVKSHVNHLLTKLRLRDRVQAVALAYRTGLMDLEKP
jgi:DNA-binding NarL/FixJ family response regulator